MGNTTFSNVVFQRAAALGDDRQAWFPGDGRDRAQEGALAPGADRTLVPTDSGGRSSGSNPGPPRYQNLSVASGTRSWREAIHTAFEANRAKFEQRRKAGCLKTGVRDRVHEYRERNREQYGTTLIVRRGWALD